MGARGKVAVVPVEARTAVGSQRTHNLGLNVRLRRTAWRRRAACG